MGDGPDIFLTRHGETVFNQEGRYQGQLDSPLTPLGVQQAEAVAGVLADRLGQRAVRVLSSPLGRAMRTACIIAEALPGADAPETDERLKEVGMGAWDGLTRAEITERWPDARRGRSTREWMFHGPGGETLEELAARLAELLDDLNNRPAGTIVLVTHAVAGRILRALHNGQPLLEALKLDAPQDAAFRLKPNGMVDMIATEPYRKRYGLS